MPQYVIVLDTPGIKQFVFGTDTLAEIRGASDLLDSLNRRQTDEQLRTRLRENEKLVCVYANGGSGQFLLETPDPVRVNEILEPIASYYREQTGGEARVLWGVAECPEAQAYRDAVRQAFQRLHLQRDSASAARTVSLIPFLQECESSSHWPAQHLSSWGGERFLLSSAARCKREQSRSSRREGIFADWMEDAFGGGDVESVENRNERLRCRDAEAIGRASRLRKGDIGMVYADGNAMGRLVRELDSPEATMAFSRVIDGSIRRACYRALGQVLDQEIAAARQALQAGRRLVPLPADILLLGGDDLLVLVPADRALRFARLVADYFEVETRQRIAELRDPAREFFRKRGLGADRGPTISCGVAIAPAKYPFYLLLDLAEELLKSAKKAGSRAPREEGGGEYRAPARIDFHLIAGSTSQNLELVRTEDYQIGSQASNAARTLRPYSLEQMERLEDGVQSVRQGQCSLARSRRQALWEAALDPVQSRAERRCREILCRLRREVRQALLRALGTSLDHFPWANSARTCTGLADLMEAWDLVEREDHT